MQVPRMASPFTNPNGYLAAAGAVFAAAVMLYNAVNHHGVIDTAVVVAAVGAVGALFSRQLVTPLKDPRDGNGTPLAIVTPQLAEVIRAASALPPGSDGPGLAAAGGKPPAGQ